MAGTKSPKYPNFSLRQAKLQAERIFKADRRNVIDREVAVKHMGYSGLSGASDKAIGTMVQYGLLEHTGKGQLKVSQRAVDLIHPDPGNDAQYKLALAQAAASPPLFKALKARFPDGVSPESLRSYLVRENFLDRAINPIIASFTDTEAFLKQEGAFESGGLEGSAGSETLDLEEEEEEAPPPKAQVGDMVTVERNGALVFPAPVRVLQIQESGGVEWVWTDGAESWTEMDTVTVESKGAPPAPQPPAPPPLLRKEASAGELSPMEGESEWMRNRLGSETKVRLMVTGDMGPREIGKLIKLLEAQRAVLQDDDDLSGL